MDWSFKRRDFLKMVSTLAAGAASARLGFNAARAAEKIVCSTPSAADMGWLVGVQLYTFRRFSFYEALDMIADLGVRHVEPCFFLPLDKNRPKLKTNEDLPPAVRKELKQRLNDRGIAMSSFYSALAADEDRAKKIFEFSKEMGADVIVAEPPAEAFDMIEELCDEYAIDVAIHNHPESPKSKYWKPENVLAVCQGRGKRIGACCDTGHWVRSGLDPVQCLKKLEGRVRGFHLKNAAEKGKRDARDVPLGQGAADYGEVLEELKRQGYRGVMMVEYEHDSPELMSDVAKCLTFVENWAKAHGG